MTNDAFYVSSAAERQADTKNGLPFGVAGKKTESHFWIVGAKKGRRSGGGRPERRGYSRIPNNAGGGRPALK
ncbi:MAG: hypothetical protein JXA11_07475, partial [Phycisphaerae bacterium]|nr:hypothetical protein [Phycisphaerae bacterium]